MPAGRNWNEVAETQLRNTPHTEIIFRKANDSMRHVVDLLGSGKVCIDHPGTTKINWHKDQISRVEWNPKTYFKLTKTVKGSGSDIKWVRELSRGAHLVRLGQANQLAKVDPHTKRDPEDYAVEAIDQILSWIDNNPWPWGSNWQCTMDVGLRVINWLFTLDLIHEGQSIANCSRMETILLSLYTHGKHIYDNPEKYAGGITNNHYLSDLVAQTILGVSLQFFYDSKKWYDDGLINLKKELSKQFLPESGLCFEASTGYNRLDYELLIALDMVFENREIQIPSWLEETIERIGKSTKQLLKSNGEVPAFGDQDDGRVLDLFPHNYQNQKYLLGWIEHRTTSESPESLWTSGPLDEQEGIDSVRADAFSFKDVGWHGWRMNYWDVTMICGPLGTNGTGGHSHNDQLSFDLAVNGVNICGDPGSFTYTSDPEMRNLYRSTQMHSTVYVDAIEQNSFDSLFKRGGAGKGVLSKWERNGNGPFLFEGQFSGPYSHTRELILDQENDILAGVDKIEINKSFKNIYWTLILSPGVETIQESVNSLRLKFGEVALILSVENNVTSKSGFIIDTISYAKSYGVSEVTSRIRCSLKNNVAFKWQLRKA